jgi:TPR repeat protein
MVKSAAQGYAPAQTTLAYILDAAEQDAEAFHWYQQAADHNNAAGLFGLGGMYTKGEGTVKDPIKGGQLIKQAAQLDHVQAMRVYAHALEHGQLGFEPNQRSAANWYLKAASRGDQISMQRLKQAYTLGQLGLPVDPQHVEAWNEKINQ